MTRSQERREQARENLRQEILTVSRKIITDEGFGALTMRKLAERIGYSPAAIYLHFRNRDEIAHEVSRAGYADLFAALSAAVAAKPSDAASRLRALCEAYVRFGLENPQTYSLIFMEDPAYLAAVLARPAADDPGARAYGLLVEAAEAVMRAGRRLPKVGKPARAATAVEFAETIWAGLHGIVSLKLTCPAFPTAPAEILTTLMVESLLGDSGGNGTFRRAAKASNGRH
ncbi:TetR/AcrR family transcriptional regulator [Edaphobacter aggregans]|uniref:TetR/AcrR family transcriptional regulator n=1 Tax=Edaphobacter aggregans TaxID=570835 RepID=UPI00068D4106|nr:TetR/AcrR family transcriptional regulator [Edaphobacter aggregans]